MVTVSCEESAQFASIHPFYLFIIHLFSQGHHNLFYTYWKDTPWSCSAVQVTGLQDKVKAYPTQSLTTQYPWQPLYHLDVPATAISKFL